MRILLTLLLLCCLPLGDSAQSADAPPPAVTGFHIYPGCGCGPGWFNEN